MTKGKEGASRRNPRRAKKAYGAPKLTVHGNIRTLTRAKAGTKGDGAQVPKTRV